MLPTLAQPRWAAHPRRFKKCVVAWGGHFGHLCTKIEVEPVTKVSAQSDQNLPIIEIINGILGT